MVRRVVRGTGRTMIAAGILILLFVAYQLWGTGIAEARSQRSLKRSFEASFALPPVPTTTTTPPTTAGSGPPPPTAVPAPTTVATQDQRPARAPSGSAVAIIKIPRIGVDKAVVEGVTDSDLKKAPGHYPNTPMPGQPGNAAIAGHRTTYGAPFGNLDDVRAGDAIFVTTRQGRFRYEVTETTIVGPDEISVLGKTPDNRLTLTTCHPKFSARQRLIVVARLTGEAVEPPPAPPPPPTPAPTGEGPTPRPTIAPETPETTAVEPPQSFEEGGNLSGVRAARGPAVLWGWLSALVALATYLLGRAWRRWPAYLIGTPVFLVVLFVFFENFSRLLPANI